MAGRLGGFPLRCCVALTAIVFNALALNLFVGPSAGAYPSYGGFAAGLAAPASYAVLLALAARRPAALEGPAVSWAALAAFAAGASLVGMGYGAESTAASLAGWLLASLATAWVMVLAGLMLARLEAERCHAPAFAAFAAVYVTASVLVPLLAAVRPGRWALLALYATTFLVAFAAARRPGAEALSAFAEGGGKAPAAAVGAEARPAARGERAHAPVLFAVLFALGIVCGYTAFVVFGTRESSGVSYVVVAAAMLTVIVAAWFARSRTDAVFHFGLLLVLAGLLVVPFVAQTVGGVRVALIHVSNTLLTAGSECFALLVWLVLASRMARQPRAALALVTGGRLAVAGGMLAGLLVGAVASSFAAKNPLVPDAVAVAFAFALVAYVLVGLRRFSFEEAVAGVRPRIAETEGADAAAGAAPDAVAAAAAAGTAASSAVPDETRKREDAAAAIARGCEALARRASLTERETEILKMLARGRSAPFIAQELVISPNTVKTHVKHIYAKLDAHSQQEVIDLVDAASAPE